MLNTFYKKSIFIKPVWFSLVLLLSLLSGTNLCKAESPLVDSLKAAIKTAESSTDSLLVMNELIQELISNDIYKAKTLATEAHILSEKANDTNAEAYVLNKLGIIFYETAQRDSSLIYFQESEKLSEEMGLTELQARNLMEIAKYYRYVKKDSSKVIEYFRKSIEVSKSIDFNWGTGRAYAKLASFYTRYNEVDLCEDYLEKSAEYYLKYYEGKKSIAHYYNEVGNKLWDTNPNRSMDLYFKGIEYKETPSLMVSISKAYCYIGEYENAKKQLIKAIPLLYKTEKRRGMLGVAIAQLAEVYIALADYQAANKTCEEGIKLLTHLGTSDQNALPTLYRAMGIINEHNNNDEKALEFYNLSLSEAIRIKNNFAGVRANLTLGNFYTNKNIKQAEKYCSTAYVASKKRKHTNLEIQACDCLYKIYKAGGAHKSALTYHEHKLTLQDSLSAFKIRHNIDVNGKLAEKDKLIADQNQLKEMKERELKNQNMLIAVLSAFMLMGIIFIGFLAKAFLRIRKQNIEINEKTEEIVKANKRLAQSNKELERFAHVTSHDLKSPLRSILSFTGLLRNKFKKEKNSSVHDYLYYIENSGKRMNQLIDDLLQFSKLSSDQVVELENVDLNELVTEIHELSSNGTDREVKLEISQLPTIKWYYSKIYLLMKNLIENGIKYNKSETPLIKVYHKTESETTSIYVSDNGIGIEEKYFNDIFTMFNRLHTQDEFDGTGLGLATCKKIVEEFEGKISISSKLGTGTIFKIDIPTQMVVQSHKYELAEV